MKIAHLIWFMLIVAVTFFEKAVEATPSFRVSRPGCVLVQCFVNPCITALCPSGTTCRANYCNGCNANCIPEGIWW